MIPGKSGPEKFIRRSAYCNFTIKGASKEKYKIVVDGMTTYQFINVDGEWYYDVNADGEIDEAEMDKRDIEVHTIIQRYILR